MGDEAGTAITPAKGEEPPQTTEQPPWDQKTVLYVGDLDPQVTESELVDVFQRNGGGISSVRLCRDLSTGRSLSYAYINFTSHDQAKKAMEWMNYTKLREKPMRIMWSQRDPHCRRTGIGNVFVKNLQPSITSARIQCIFCAYGTVLSCKVATEDDGNSKGFGFVQFESEDSAIAAVEALHNTILEGKKLYVSKFVKRSERKFSSGEEEDSKFTNLYVKNLSKELTTEEELTKKFEELGKVTSVLLARDESGNPKGFGFVNFEKAEDAKKAIDKLNGQTTIKGMRSLFVGRAQKKSEREKVVVRGREATVYVNNIEKTMGEESVKDYFSSCGAVSSVKIMRDDNGENKGFGFVTFSAPHEAKKALSSLNGRMMGGRRITVAAALRKEERAAATATVTPSQQQQQPPPPGFQFQSYSFPPPPPIPPQYSQLTYDPSYIYHRHIYGPPPPPTQAFYPISSQCYPQQPTISNYWLGGQGGGSTTTSMNMVAKGRRNSNRGVGVGVGEKNVGEKLFQMVCKIEPERARKVTGMLMEMNKVEVSRAMSSPNYLASKVVNAVQFLDSSSNQPPLCS